MLLWAYDDHMTSLCGAVVEVCMVSDGGEPDDWAGSIDDSGVVYVGF